VAVVPFGGGTSVVGGVSPLPGRFPAVVSLDLRRMDRLVRVDEHALTATFEPGVRGPEAERLLAAYGLTLGHFPQSYEHASLGGYAATRSAGQASTGYGRFDELVVGIELQTPAGALGLGRGAATAAGPDLMALALGSEGVLGVVTSVTVKVRRVPAVKRYEGVFFRTWQEGCAALREMEQERVAPDVARLSDPDETRSHLALAGTGGLKGRVGRLVLRARGYRGGCLAVFGWEGTESGVAARRKASLSVASRHGAFVVGTSVGDRWEHGRYDGPYLREDLLDAGYLVETLETSATWSRLDATHEAVRRALQSELPRAIVMCHVSHLYAHGGSLYFTVLAARDEDDPVGQWQRAKDAACAALVATGATITHHHAVGTDHRDWMTAEVGPLGVEVLRAVKATLDPTGILNPGKLIPDLEP
jgi:alkyldihydroxyacetonephosphate synthase